MYYGCCSISVELRQVMVLYPLDSRSRGFSFILLTVNLFCLPTLMKQRFFSTKLEQYIHEINLIQMNMHAIYFVI